MAFRFDWCLSAIGEGKGDAQDEKDIVGDRNGGFIAWRLWYRGQSGQCGGEERIQELGLTEADLVSEYCIMDDSDELIQLKITDESFFLDYLQNGYGEKANQYPLFIWLNDDGSVERLMEKPLA